MKPLDSIIVFTTPRSGSSLLGNWLETFLPKHYQTYEPASNDRIDKIWSTLAKGNNMSNDQHLSKYDKLIQVEKYRKLIVKIFSSDTDLLKFMVNRKVIILNRKDIRKQCLSHLISLKTNQWNDSVPNKTVNLHLTKEEVLADITRQLLLIKKFDKISEILIKTSDVILKLEYEDFENDLDALFTALQPVLGLTDADRERIPNKFVKQNIDHEGKFSNIELFDELWEQHKHLSGRY